MAWQTAYQVHDSPTLVGQSGQKFGTYFDKARGTLAQIRPKVVGLDQNKSAAVYL